MLSAVKGLKLTSINVTSCSAVTQEGFLRLATACPRLSVVGLASCRRVFAGLSKSTRDICHSMSQLTSLNLSNLSVPHFSELGALPHLKHLTFDNLDAPGREILACLSRLDVRRLVSLQARYLAMSSQELLQVIANRTFPRLRRLDLSHGQDNITDEVLMVGWQKSKELVPY